MFLQEEAQVPHTLTPDRPLANMVHTAAGPASWFDGADSTGEHQPGECQRSGRHILGGPHTHAWMHAMLANDEFKHVTYCHSGNGFQLTAFPQHHAHQH
jgi:hypothetical protein